MERKEFIKVVLRLGIVTGMVVGTTHLVKNKQIDYSCSVDGVCKSCSIFGTCKLDKAIKIRNNEQ